MESLDNETERNNINILENINLEKVKEIIKMAENPSPINVLLLALLVCVVFYIIYIYYIKYSPEGEWVCDKSRYTIKHNKITNDISILIDDYYVYGKLRTNVILLNNNNECGACVADTIKWTNGKILKRNYGI